MPLVDARGLEAELQRFANERGFERYHSPKNLAMALTGEVGELVEIFQWMTEDQSRQAMADSATARHIREELADVLIYVVRLASKLGIDLDAAVADKLAKNAAKYPDGSRPSR